MLAHKPSKGGSMSDAEDGGMMADASATPEPTRRSASAASGAVVMEDKAADESASPVTPSPAATVSPQVVSELRRQLLEKDNLLTETRLEALSSAHQLESLRETVSRMRSELITLKSDNEKLNCMVPQEGSEKSAGVRIGNESESEKQRKSNGNGCSNGLRSSLGSSRSSISTACTGGSGSDVASGAGEKKEQVRFFSTLK